MSLFHDTHQYYADGVEMSDIAFPEGWQGRLLTLEIADADEATISAMFPEIHDLCAAKLGAGRPQDRRFVQAIARHTIGTGSHLIDLQRLQEVADKLPEPARTVAAPLVASLHEGNPIAHPNPPT